jgi:hypothetical protein
MVSESEFFSKADKALELDSRLRGLYAQGKISTEDYAVKRAELNGMLQELKGAQLVLIQLSIEEIRKALAKIELSRNTAKVTKGQYEGMKRDLSMQESELDSKREVIELSGWDDYVKYLRQDVEDKKYKRYRRGLDPRAVLDGLVSKEVESAPTWVWVSAQLFVIVAIGLGLLSSSGRMLFILPVGTLAYVVFSTVLLDKATNLTGIKKTSGAKAFTATMTVGLVMFAAIAALLVTSYLLPAGGAIQRATIENLVYSIQSLQILPLIGFGAMVFSVYITYDTNISKSATAAFISCLVMFVAVWLMSVAGLFQ